MSDEATIKWSCPIGVTGRCPQYQWLIFTGLEILRQCSMLPTRLHVVIARFSLEGDLLSLETEDGGEACQRISRVRKIALRFGFGKHRSFERRLEWCEKYTKQVIGRIGGFYECAISVKPFTYRSRNVVVSLRRESNDAVLLRPGGWEFDQTNHGEVVHPRRGFIMSGTARFSW